MKKNISTLFQISDRSARFFFQCCLLAGLLFFCLTPKSVSAQNWRPLKVGYSHVFNNPSPAWDLYRIQVDSTREINGDSVFYVNKTARSNSFPNYYPPWEYWKDNILGSGWVEMPGGKISFFPSFGDSVHFFLQKPLNNKWLFHGQSDSAWVTNRGTSPIFGTIDSVITVQTQSGHRFKFSKHHGIIALTDLRNWTENITYGYMTLESPPEKRLKPGEWFTWQPGDFIGYHLTTWGPWPSTQGNDQYTYLTILDRTDYPGLDSVSFTFRRETVSFSRWVYQSYHIDTTIGTYSFVNSYLPTWSITPDPQSNSLVEIPVNLKRDSHGELKTETILGEVMPGIGFISFPSNSSGNYEYRHPVDLWYRSTGSHVEYIEGCSCYRIGTDSSGYCPPVSVLMGREAELESSFAVYPNPAQDLIHVDFGKQNLPLPVRWQIFDLQGRELRKGGLEQQSAAISVEELPEGILLLQIEGVAKPVKLLHRR